MPPTKRTAPATDAVQSLTAAKPLDATHATPGPPTDLVAMPRDLDSSVDLGEDITARRRADQIKFWLRTMVDKQERVLVAITEAQAEDDHLALGYPSWPAYVTAEFGGLLSQLNREDRRAAAFTLSATGLSTRGIASVMGVGKSTVNRILGAGVPHGTPGATTTVGPDGKRYPRPEPRPARRRPPLDHAYRDAAFDVEAKIRRLERLHKDDRFERHKAGLLRYRNDMQRARDRLDVLLDQFGAVVEGRVVS